MPVTFKAYRTKCPWCLRYKNPWTGKSRVSYFETDVKARQYEELVKDLYLKEKELLQKMKKNSTVRTLKKISLTELLNRYVGSLQNATTQNTTRDHLESVYEIYGKRKAHCITCDDVNAWMSVQKQRGVGLTTIHRRASILRTACNWGVKNHFLGSNPLSGLVIPSTQSRRIAPPSIREARLIYKAGAPHVQRVVLLGMATGARVGPSELFRLCWSDVDLANGIIRMPNAYKGANTESRDVPIRADIQDQLKLWQEEDDRIGCPYVIHYRGKSVRSISKAWHKALFRAGITRRIRPYDLRHAFASHSLANEADIKCVAEIMGHRNANMLLKIYQHTFIKQRQKAVNAAPGLFSKSRNSGRKQGPLPRPGPPASPPGYDFIPSGPTGSSLAPTA